MLKFELDSLDNLDESIKALYQKEGDKYRLKIDGMPKIEDVSGLKRQVEDLMNQRKADLEKRKEAEEAAEAAKREALKKNGDVESLEKSWHVKFDKMKNDLTSELDQYKETVISLTSGQTAVKIASELAAVVNGASMAPHLEHIISARLKTEYKDGKPVTTVLDKNGQPSAMSIDELKAEIQKDPINAPLVAGTKASGPGQHGKDGNLSFDGDMMKLNPVERMNAARAAMKK